MTQSHVPAGTPTPLGMPERRTAAAQAVLHRHGLTTDPDDIETLLVPLAEADDTGAVTAVVVAHGLVRTEGDPDTDGTPQGVIATAKFTPGPAFVTDASNSAAGLRRLYHGAGDAVTYTLVVGLALLIPGVAVPALVRAFVDIALVGGDRATSGVIVAALIGCAALQFLLALLLYGTLARLGQRIQIRNYANFVWHLLSLPTRVVGRWGAGNLAMRSAANQRLGLTAGLNVPSAVLNAVSVVFYLAVMAVFDLVLTGLTMAVLVVNAVVIQEVFRRQSHRQAAALTASADLDAATVAGIGAIESLKATASEHEFFAHWSHLQRRYANANSRLGMVGQLLAALPVFVGVVAMTVVVAVGSLQVMSGAITLGTLVAYQGLLAAVLVPVNQLSYAGVLIQNMTGRVDQLGEVLAEPIDIELAAASVLTPVQPSGRLRGEISITNLTFGYTSGRPPLIEGLDLDVTPGRRVALVGPSGSGKSTIARLLTGQLEPWAGTIRIDGVPRALLSRTSLAASVTYVAQEVTLLEGSVTDNITMFDPDITAESVVRAAADAGLLDEIVARPGGLGSHVDVGGRNLSGGQRQRLAIARALATNPAVLILDEATSALDPIVEATVEANIRARGCTCVVVAHRLSTVRDADEIVVLDAGRVVQRGTHDALVAVDGLYKDLVSG
jgi:ABC-type bacteriocin/lantibiotic exporter with double-glycine peptidase domain